MKSWRKAQTVRKAYEFNYPLIARMEKQHEGVLPRSYSFLEVEPENVVISSLKMAEDNKGIVLRLYEAHGIDVNAKFTAFWKIEEAYESDILESESHRRIKDISKIPLSHNEVKTLKIFIHQSHFEASNKLSKLP